MKGRLIMRRSYSVVVAASVSVFAAAAAQASGPGACGAGGDCMSAHAAPGCDDVACCSIICDIDAYCCDVEWDESCAEQAALACTTPDECPADVDDSGEVDLDDFLGVLSEWGSPGGPYDIHPVGLGDEIVDVGDFLLVLAEWGPCPVTCAPAAPCTGACCRNDGTCVFLTAAQCQAIGGALYLGDNTWCPPNIVQPAGGLPGANGTDNVGSLPDFTIPNAAGPAADGGIFPEMPLNQGGTTQSSLRRDGHDFSTMFQAWNVNGIDLIPGFDVGGRIRYPAQAAGGLEVPCRTGRHPLVIFVHGNHRPYQGSGDPSTSDQNYRGYTYLQDLLATRRFISLSINVDDFYRIYPGILARAWVVLCHLENMERWDNQAGHILAGHIDWSRIILVGHSRGGEAIVQAQMMNQQVGGANRGPAVGPGAGEGRFRIRGLFSLAATRFFDQAINYDINAAPEDVVPSSALTAGLPFLGMWGDADGDVVGSGGVPAPIGAGTIRSNHVEGAYDLCPPESYRQMVWVEGANHNYWNTSWSQDDGVNTGLTVMPRADQMELAKAYGVAFLLTYVRGEVPYQRYFRVPANLLSPTDPGAIAADNVHIQFQAPRARRRVVDNFQAHFDSTTITSEFQAPVTVTNLEFLPGGAVEPELIGAAITPHDTQSFFHDTRGVLFKWALPAPPPAAYLVSYETVLLTNKSRDVSNYPFLSFRIAQDRRDVANSGANLDVRVQLVDTGNVTSSFDVTTANWTRIPVHRIRTDSGLLTKSMLKTIRIRLCDFVQNEAALDLKKIKAVRFIFLQRVAGVNEFGRAAGQAAIDDIEFTESGPLEVP